MSKSVELSQAEAKQALEWASIADGERGTDNDGLPEEIALVKKLCAFSGENPREVLWVVLGKSSLRQPAGEL